MIREFVERFQSPEGQASLRAAFSKRPDTYQDVVRAVIEVVAGSKDWDVPDPDRIHAIDDGDYQGTLVFVIAEKGYQPSRYWYAKVGYGSCSGCDTLQAICSYSSDAPTDDEISQYMTLALHIVQGLKEMGSGDE
jgi:hypothetical protein